MGTPNIETYKMSTGYYDTAKIREDAGMDSRSAAFLDIFGSFDDDGKDTGGDLPGEWQALLDEAERRNAEMLAQPNTEEMSEDVEVLTDQLYNARGDVEKDRLYLQRARVMARKGREAIEQEYQRCVARERTGETPVQANVRRVFEDWRYLYQRDLIIWCGNAQVGDVQWRGATPIRILEIIEEDYTPIPILDEEDAERYEGHSPRQAVAG